MFMAWTKYCYKANSRQVELRMFIVSTQFQPKYQQDFFFFRTDKLFLRFKQKYRVAKIASFQNKQPSGRTHTSWFQSVSKATVIKKVSQRNRSMDHNEKSRDRSIHIQSIDFLQRYQGNGTFNEKETSFQQMGCKN